MFSKLSPVIRTILALLAFAIAIIGLFTSVYLAQYVQSDMESVEIGSALAKLKRESEIAKYRGVPTRLVQASLDKNEFDTLYLSTANAIAMQEPDGFSAAMRDLESHWLTGQPYDEKLLSLRRAGSDLFAARARRRRFESDRLLESIVSTRTNLRSEPDSSRLQNRLKILEETRSILISEYSGDDKRAIELNRDNYRAYYDLARFYQDRHTPYDNYVAIRNFERVAELMRGKVEKDADFVRAILNLAILYYLIGDEPKARCYASETIEKYYARKSEDLDYLFGYNSDGLLNEPEFIDANNHVNPKGVRDHPDCGVLK